MFTNKSLSRRTFLHGSGITLALPLLDAMLPARAQAKTAPPLRLGFVYVPNGIIMNEWTPTQVGALTDDLPPILAPLKELRSQILLLSGLTLNGGRALGDGPGDHARAAASFLTGAHPRKTAGADINNGISVDQVAARHLGQQTRFASLELSCEDGRLVGSCDSGYACAYSNAISWRSATTPATPEINPRHVFERLFGEAAENAATRTARQRTQRSILDFVRQDTQALQRELGQTDRRKLDEYLTAVRDIEQRIAKSAGAQAAGSTSIDKPAGVPAEFVTHLRLMYELLLTAWQTDQTRIATLMVGREGSGRTYRELGIAEGHHALTHHQNNAEKIEQVGKINRYHFEQFAWFLNQLKATPDGDGNLLDHSLVLYGSGLSDGNRHRHEDLPILLAGDPALTRGRHLRYEKETPLANFYLGLLHRLGVKADTFSDSTGVLDSLA